MARNHSSRELNFFFKVLRQLKSNNNYLEYETKKKTLEKRKEGIIDNRELEL